MEIIDLIWLSAFFFLLVILNVVLNLIIHILREKPLGKQSIFDASIQDTCKVAQMFGTLSCVMCIFARFVWFRNIITGNDWLTTTCCLIYNFCFTALCVSIGCMFVTRIACIKNMTFVEESVGEIYVRIIFSGITILSGILVCSVISFQGEIKSFTPLALLTGQIVLPGNYSLK